MADHEMHPSPPEPVPTAATLRRRWLRWLTLGEILGVAALLISALTLWNNYDERRQAQADHQREERHADTKVRTLVLKATVEQDGAKLGLSALGDQVIQSQTISFPKALNTDPVDSSDPRIEPGWFSNGLKAARKEAGEAERPKGDARLPIAITTRFVADGALIEQTALYDLGYAMRGTLFGGSEVRLRGLSLLHASSAKAAQVQLDTLWKARHPAPKA